MFKKVTAFLVITGLLLSFSACGKSSSADRESRPEKPSQSSSKPSLPPSTEVTSSDNVSSDSSRPTSSDETTVSSEEESSSDAGSSYLPGNDYVDEFSSVDVPNDELEDLWGSLEDSTIS